MPKNRRKPSRRAPRIRHNDSLPPESRGGEVVTIAWTVSVTGVVMADLMVVAAHLIARSYPDAPVAQLLEIVMLLSATALGVVSLVLLPIVWTTRRLKPPRGYIAFAVLVATAPLSRHSLALSDDGMVHCVLSGARRAIAGAQRWNIAW